jgi:hypothetical protein
MHIAEKTNKNLIEESRYLEALLDDKKAWGDVVFVGLDTCLIAH